MNTFTKLIQSIKTAYYNKQFIKKHGNRFLTCIDNKQYNRYNGQVINTINPLNIKIKLAKNGQVVTLKASEIIIINKDHKRIYNYQVLNNKPTITLS
jgi:hypothetical protein